MHFNKALAVVGSLALASLVSAVPVEKRGSVFYGDRTQHLKDYQANQGNAGPSSSGGSWAPSSTGGAPPAPPQQTSGTPPPPATPSSQGSNPFKFPLQNGFPNIQNPSAALTQIEQQAHGLLPNGPPPPSAPAADDLTSLRLIAFNEIFEVAYFTELLSNVTNNVVGYQFQDANLRETIIEALTAIVAQEELHALNANGALAHFNAGPIQPCLYNAPVDNFQDAIALASTFTDVVLGTLGDVQVHFGQNGDAGLIRGVAAVIGQEGEQNGFYREILGELPSQAPFLTASAREFAFSALNQNFVVPGSCPNSNTIALPIFGALTLETPKVQAQDQQLQFSFQATGQYSQYASGQGLSLVYINQQNVPVVVPIQGAQNDGGKVTFSANFPFSENLMFGLTIAAVTSNAGPFADVDAVAKAALFGPALIEVQ
ncbi:hypothetical protein, variant [Exophiala oligosperma]|uniref:Late sexual development protein n=2 Tax=Chaetothyriales TaxID=34395 RepID=A0A0D2DEL0_9EURO|nr:uncharacterized protein PV06_07015 [Exophiala oligosperma]XP_016261675.1 hypothetical protein, variant [Exophiala oligosperma]KAJ9640743.1 hypothetical protein H2204_003032 [Knufia peltigerae]KIW41458.1 hypothetical protein PV06_07015 [Exophiala oligosperma]KIW41459.1 hypothetical protein, variant [Exophiala oligosperma]